MPIPTPQKGERTDEFLSRCIKAISGEYPSDQAYAICQKKIENRSMSEEMFVLKPKKSESRGMYLTRCSQHSEMKKQFPSMKTRMNECLHSFNSYYKYWNRLEEFESEEHPDMKFEGCMSKHKALGKDYKEAYTMCMSELIVEPVAMENMDTNIGDCIEKRIRENKSLTKEEARKRCAASVVVQPSGGSNPVVVGNPVIN
jgi:DNA-binding ferritin-like protein (Dps family)